MLHTYFNLIKEIRHSVAIVNIYSIFYIKKLDFLKLLKCKKII